MERAVFPAPRPRFVLRAAGRSIFLGERTLVTGVLNCTPDSFSDGGRYLEAADAARRLAEIEDEGADWCDVGGESSRPGAEPVAVEEEWRRIAPALREARKSHPRLVLSVDTTKAEIARRALEEGASIINDISGLRFDPEMAQVVARHEAGLVLMHMRGDPRTMQQDPVYDDVTAEVAAFLSAAAAEAERRGVKRGQILIDPGIGFGKTVEHNLTLLRRLPDLAAAGYPIVIGASRKSFIGKVLGLEVRDRLEGSLAAHVIAALAGAHLVRAHDVQATVRAVRLADAVRST